MKNLMLSFIIIGCAKVPVKDEWVTVNAALNHAQASYLRGCVDAKHELKLKGVFEGCRNNARNHRDEIQALMDQEL